MNRFHNPMNPDRNHLFRDLTYVATRPLHLSRTLPDMKPRHDVRNLVRLHRLLKGLTQTELAEHLGVTRQSVLSIEKAKNTPSVALALSLAEVFEVSVETLFQLNKGGGGD